MNMPDDNEPFSRRIVLKVPTYMPELREELLQYPERQWTKRMLQLANLGLIYSRINAGSIEVPHRKQAQQKTVTKTPAPAPVVTDTRPNNGVEIQSQPVTVNPQVHVEPSEDLSLLPLAEEQPQQFLSSEPSNVTPLEPQRARRTIRNPPQMTE